MLRGVFTAFAVYCFWSLDSYSMQKEVEKSEIRPFVRMLYKLVEISYGEPKNTDILFDAAKELCITEKFSSYTLEKLRQTGIGKRFDNIKIVGSKDGTLAETYLSQVLFSHIGSINPWLREGMLYGSKIPENINFCKKWLGLGHLNQVPRERLFNKEEMNQLLHEDDNGKYGLIPRVINTLEADDMMNGFTVIDKESLFLDITMMPFLGQKDLQEIKTEVQKLSTKNLRVMEDLKAFVNTYISRVLNLPDIMEKPGIKEKREIKKMIDGFPKTRKDLRSLYKTAKSSNEVLPEFFEKMEQQDWILSRQEINELENFVLNSKDNFENIPHTQALNKEPVRLCLCILNQADRKELWDQMKIIWLSRAEEEERKEKQQKEKQREESKVEEQPQVPQSHQQPLQQPIPYQQQALTPFQTLQAMVKNGYPLYFGNAQKIIEDFEKFPDAYLNTNELIDSKWVLDPPELMLSNLADLTQPASENINFINFIKSKPIILLCLSLNTPEERKRVWDVVVQKAQEKQWREEQQRQYQSLEHQQGFSIPTTEEVINSIQSIKPKTPEEISQIIINCIRTRVSTVELAIQLIQQAIYENDKDLNNPDIWVNCRDSLLREEKVSFSTLDPLKIQNKPNYLKDNISGRVKIFVGSFSIDEQKQLVKTGLNLSLEKKGVNTPRKRFLWDMEDNIKEKYAQTKDALEMLDALGDDVALQGICEPWMSQGKKIGYKQADAGFFHPIFYRLLKETNGYQGKRIVYLGGETIPWVNYFHHKGPLASLEEFRQKFPTASKDVEKFCIAAVSAFQSYTDKCVDGYRGDFRTFVWNMNLGGHWVTFIVHFNDPTRAIQYTLINPLRFDETDVNSRAAWESFTEKHAEVVNQKLGILYSVKNSQDFNFDPNSDRAHIPYVYGRIGKTLQQGDQECGIAAGFSAEQIVSKEYIPNIIFDNTQIQDRYFQDYLNKLFEFTKQNDFQMIW